MKVSMGVVVDERSDLEEDRLGVPELVSVVAAEPMHHSWDVEIVTNS